MNPESDLLDQLIAHSEIEEQRKFLTENARRLDPEETARRLKEESDRYLRVDIQRALSTAELLGDFAVFAAEPRFTALSLLAEANARYIGLGEYEKAVSLYDQAGQIYHSAGQVREEAIAQIGRTGALLNLGRYEEALEGGIWAAGVLADSEDWFELAKLNGNLGIVHFRRGNDQLALSAFEQAQSLYEHSKTQETGGWLRAEFNRAIVLRNLGRFDESIRASNRASDALTRLGHTVDAARANQSLALTYYVLGKYNEALAILDEVRTVFAANQRRRDAVLTELFISDCLLQLRRFEDVLEKCEQVRTAFTELGTRFEVTLAILNEAVAFAGLARFESALASLHEARTHFLDQGSYSWAAYCDLEIAEITLQTGDPESSLKIALDCVTAFDDQPAKQAQARLVASQAALAAGDSSMASDLVKVALDTSRDLDLPSLGYLCHYVRGQIAEKAGDLARAIDDYAEAIQDLELLRGQLMVEFRSGFVEDKQRIYEDIVTALISIDKPQEALEYTERAKSRALIDLLANRLDLGIHPRAARDQPIVDELQRLRAERDRLYRRWEGSTQEELRERGWNAFQENRGQVQSEVLKLEKKITGLWHQLLIRNAAYAHDASLWQVRVEPFQEYLQPDTMLIEYYYARGVVYAFLITRDSIEVCNLKANLQQIQNSIGLLRLNFRSVPRSEAARIPLLTRNAQGLLRQFHQMLIEPFAAGLSAETKLIFIPHGPLHYLPFQAFYDGEAYLIETHEISYLPGASVLRYPPKEEVGSGALILGHTNQGQLPNTVREARKIGDIWESVPYLEREASIEAFREHAVDKKLIHLATHGDFRADNPLFSGLALANGWLTTLDIFNLKLKASLVALSACETGRSVIGGGDELLGLMRAFLSAGAVSLLLSLWSVEDESTAILMEQFNRALLSVEKPTKGAALRAAQLPFISGESSEDPSLQEAYRHPYFWAPFILVGDAGEF